MEWVGSTVSLIVAPEGDIRESGKEVMFKELKGENFPELLKDTHF